MEKAGWSTVYSGGGFSQIPADSSAAKPANFDFLARITNRSMTSVIHEASQYRSIAGGLANRGRSSRSTLIRSPNTVSCLAVREPMGSSRVMGASAEIHHAQFLPSDDATVGRPFVGTPALANGALAVAALACRCTAWPAPFSREPRHLSERDRSPDTLLAPAVRAPCPPQFRLAASLIKMVRFNFSHRGLIRYKCQA